MFAQKQQTQKLYVHVRIINLTKVMDTMYNVSSDLDIKYMLLTAFNLADVNRITGRKL